MSPFSARSRSTDRLGGRRKRNVWPGFASDIERNMQTPLRNVSRHQQQKMQGILEKDHQCVVQGASVRNSVHGKGHEEGGFGIRKGGIEPQETPCSRASTPKTRVCFMLSPIPLTLWGADSPTTSLVEEVNLQLQLIKIPGRDKSVSTCKLL